MEETIKSSELLSRFITQKAYYRPSDRTVKHNAFMPNKEGETSVYRIIGLSDRDIFEIGQRFVADNLKKPRPLLGRADIEVLKILERNLSVISSPEPHPRHANIVDWPENSEKTRFIAIELAGEAKLHLL